MAVERITAYLQAGGTPSMAMVAQGTGIKTALLRRLAQSGRVILGDGGVPAGTCVVCGRAVAEPAARMCPQCARRMAPRGRAGVDRPVGSAVQNRPGRGGFYSQHGGGCA